MDGHAISFGPFRLLAAQRLLLEGDRAVRLGGRAFDILTALVERAGEVVNRQDLIARAWPRTFVEEGNLKIQVGALRRALGDGQDGNRYIVTVVGRGYNFVAPIHKVEPARASPFPTTAPAALHNLPFATTRMIGREERVTALAKQLSHQRLVTIVGPGGIGKTTVALAVAEWMIGVYEHGVWLVDLAPLSDPGLVPSAVATVLGVEVSAEDALPGLVAALRDNRTLLMLDNCEHVIDAAAGFAAAVLGGASGVHILATSREPLRVPGERVHRLGPLNCPEPSPGLTAAEVSTFSAVQLFAERVSAIVEDFTLTDANASLAAAICRKLDGLPLAIEFAAPRVEFLGVEGLAAGLDHSLPLLTARRRTAMPRHRTMQAVIDWSYSLLSEAEQRLFRALGIFAGGFTSDAVSAVASDAAREDADAINRLADLVAKSLVVADVSGTKPRFRLLDTTRAYAIEKLDESGERERLAHRHAEYYRDLFEHAEAASEMRHAAEWLAEYGPEIDNLRVALNWAFSIDSDETIGVALTAAAVPLWLHLSLLEECRTRVEHALSTTKSGTALETYIELKLRTALVTSQIFSEGQITGVRVAWIKVLEIAQSIGDAKYSFRAQEALWVIAINRGEFRESAILAKNSLAAAAAGDDPRALLLADRMVGTSLHYLGEQAQARRHLESALLRDSNAAHRSAFWGSQVDPQVSIRATLARIFWLQGFPDQAWQMAQDCVAEAVRRSNAILHCFALTWALFPVALSNGYLSAARDAVATLSDISIEHRSGPYIAWGRLALAILQITQGDIHIGIAGTRSALDELRKRRLRLFYMSGLSKLAEASGLAGRPAEGLATIDKALKVSDQREERWCVAELLRVRGDLVLLARGLDAEQAAESIFLESLQQARAQSVLSFELRTAISLARLLHEQNRRDEAVDLLTAVYHRFAEGFATRDLVSARQLLNQLAKT